MRQGVFLSYRRADSAGHAGRLGSDLARLFGGPVVFRDIDSISVGSDFVEALRAAIVQARVVVVLIGRDWLAVRGADGERRLDNPGDHVRREIELALSSPRATVVPVLVEGAAMPDEGQLPESLRRLARLQAIELSEARWDFDLDRLARVLRSAGVTADGGARLPRWLVPLLLALLVAAVVASIWCWQSAPAPPDRYTGLWYLPNGSFWTVREQGSGLWVEETHHESQEVWKRGPATVEAGVMRVALELVFERQPFRYEHELRLSGDGRTLLGHVRRSDDGRERSLALTRTGS